MHATTKLLLGPSCALAAWSLAVASGLPSAASWTASITVLCAVWWVTEAIPIPATSLIPFGAFPMLGILTPTELAGSYGHPLILLLLGGFLLSASMERSGAHRRLAISLMRTVGGTRGPRIVLSFMLAAAVLSMWVSNTATTLMLLPVASAVVQEKRNASLEKPLLLGIAYASSIGGLGTPIGTPPNVVFMGVYREVVGDEISFLDWMMIGVPAVILLLPISWWLLTRGITGNDFGMNLSRERWQPRERRVLLVFGITALLWMTRQEPFGGWADLIPNAGADDGTIALLAVVALFILPDGSGARMLDWEATRKLPWGLLLLFAGGLALAKAFGTSGLSQSIGEGLAQFATLPKFVMIGALCLIVTFLTEITSNTALATLLMPILAATALATGQDPRTLMIPAALSASCAFMLPVATVPNAIVFGTGRVTIQDMTRAGLRLNLAAVGALSLLCTLML
jgi:sodium-dependent dicarboxylate transporter 2/3/5